MFYKVNLSNSLLDSYANIRIQSDLHLGHVRCLLLMLARKTVKSRVVITIYLNYYFELNVSFQLSRLAIWGSH